MLRKFIFVSVVAGLTSCSDEEVIPVERMADDYMPNTIGSTWSYTSGFFDFTQTVTSKGKKIDGKTYYEYRVAIEGFPDFKAYARKEGGNYTNREVYEGQYDDGEYIFLKDAPEGTYWTEYTYEEDIETTDLHFIVETGETVTVNGTIYTDVIVVEVSSLTEGSTEPYILYYYYAKGVGLIQIIDDFEVVATSLLNYTIK